MTRSQIQCAPKTALLALLLVVRRRRRTLRGNHPAGHASRPALHLQDARGGHPARTARERRGGQHGQDLRLQRHRRDDGQEQDRQDARPRPRRADPAADLLVLPGHPDQPAARDDSARRREERHLPDRDRRPAAPAQAAGAVRPRERARRLSPRGRHRDHDLDPAQVHQGRQRAQRRVADPEQQERRVHDGRPVGERPDRRRVRPERLRAHPGHQGDGRAAARGDAQVRADPPRARRAGRARPDHREPHQGRRDDGREAASAHTRRRVVRRRREARAEDHRRPAHELARGVRGRQRHEQDQVPGVGARLRGEGAGQQHPGVHAQEHERRGPRRRPPADHRVRLGRIAGQQARRVAGSAARRAPLPPRRPKDAARSSRSSRIRTTTHS